MGQNRGHAWTKAFLSIIHHLLSCTVQQLQQILSELNQEYPGSIQCGTDSCPTCRSQAQVHSYSSDRQEAVRYRFFSRLWLQHHEMQLAPPCTSLRWTHLQVQPCVADYCTRLHDLVRAPVLHIGDTPGEQLREGHGRECKHSCSQCSHQRCCKSWPHIRRLCRCIDCYERNVVGSTLDEVD